MKIDKVLTIKHFIKLNNIYIKKQFQDYYLICTYNLDIYSIYTFIVINYIGYSWINNNSKMYRLSDSVIENYMRKYTSSIQTSSIPIQGTIYATIDQSEITDFKSFLYQWSLSKKKN